MVLPEGIVRVVNAVGARDPRVCEEACAALPTLLLGWLQGGGDVNERTADGEPLLVFLLDAARSAPPPVEAIKVVLAAGADPDAHLNDMESSETPFTAALWFAGLGMDHGWRDVVCELIAHGAQLDLRDCDGDTPLKTVLQISVENSKRKLDLLHLLLRHGADFSKSETLMDLLDDTVVAPRLRRVGVDYESAVEAHYRARALLTAVISAGSWRKYLREPRVRLDTLRVLCARGRAAPPPGPLARLFPCDAPCAGSVRARRVVPLDVFRKILGFWRSDRDELPPIPPLDDPFPAEAPAAVGGPSDSSPELESPLL